jgi:hypothetical protein
MLVAPPTWPLSLSLSVSIYLSTYPVQMMNINARLNLLKIAHMIILIMFIFFSSNPHHAIGKSLKSPKLVFVSHIKGPVAPSAPSACTYIPGNKGGHCWMQLRARASNTYLQCCPALLLQWIFSLTYVVQYLYAGSKTICALAGNFL